MNLKDPGVTGTDRQSKTQIKHKVKDISDISPPSFFNYVAVRAPEIILFYIAIHEHNSSETATILGEL